MIESGTSAELADFQSAWAGFAVLAVLMWPYVRDQREYLVTIFQKPASWRRLVLISISIGLLMRAVSWGIAFIETSLGQYGLPGDWVSPQYGFQWNCPETGFIALGIVTTALAIPFIEETINRGFILSTCVRDNWRFPVLGSAVLFAVLHRPEAIPGAFLFGIVAAIQMMHSRSLWGPLIAHATYNAMDLVDNHCWSNSNVEVALLALPREQLALLGAAIAAVFFLLCLRTARWSGAETS